MRPEEPPKGIIGPQSWSIFETERMRGNNTRETATKRCEYQTAISRKRAWGSLPEQTEYPEFCRRSPGPQWPYPCKDLTAAGSSATFVTHHATSVPGVIGAIDIAPPHAAGKLASAASTRQGGATSRLPEDGGLTPGGKQPIENGNEKK